MAHFEYLPEEAILQLRELASALSLWQLVLLAIWFLLFVLRQLCDRVLEAAFLWLVNSVRQNGKQPAKGTSVQEGRKGKLEGVDIMDKDRYCSGTSSSSEIDEDDHIWQEYFADPSQWWDNRCNKRNPKAPDFKHRTTKRALWVDGWYTPKWVKDRLL